MTQKEEEEVTPIRASTASILARCQQLELELGKKPINTKTLQIVLQGSVLLTVNEGKSTLPRPPPGQLRRSAGDC